MLPLATPLDQPMAMGVTSAVQDLYKYPSQSSSEEDKPPVLQLGYIPLSATHPAPMPAKQDSDLKLPYTYIQPCTDFTRHTEWLCEYFPKVMDNKTKFLVQMILKIKSSEDMDKFLSFGR